MLLASPGVQSDVMRFEGRFSARLRAAYEPLLTSASPDVRLEAERELLAYAADALDVAAGSAPEVNLLDMVTLVELGRAATDRRWRPHPAAAALRRAFEAAATDVWALAERALSRPQCAALREVIAGWLDTSPDRAVVAGVRLSELARASPDGERARGLFADVKDAVRTADEALVLGDRALYVAQRMPFLLRMQVRLTAHELAADARPLVRRALVAAAGVAGVWVLARLLSSRSSGTTR